MWSFDIQFDTKFFAVSMCMANHLRVNVVFQFTVAVRNFVNYMAAQKRIQVDLNLLSYLFGQKYISDISSA